MKRGFLPLQGACLWQELGSNLDGLPCRAHQGTAAGSAETRALGVLEKLLIGCPCISGPMVGRGLAREPCTVSEESLGTLGKCPDAGSLPPHTESCSPLHFCPNNLLTQTSLSVVFFLVTPAFCCSLVTLVV